MELAPNRVKDILHRLEYKILDEAKEKLTLEVPFFRTDVVVEDDLVADVLRINDYSKIPVKTMHLAPPKEITPKIYDFEEKLKDVLVGLGMHEHITDPMVAMNKNNLEQIKLLNALTADKSALRSSIFETLLPVLNTYKKHKQNEIFEIGKEYTHQSTKPDKYIETRVLGAIYEKEGLSAYQTVLRTKQMLAATLQNIGVDNYLLEKSGEIANVLINGEKVGELVHNRFKIYTESLLPFEKVPQRVVSEISNYIIENLSLVLDKNLAFGPIFDYIKNFNPHIVDEEVIEEYVGEGLGKNKKTILLKITFSTSETQQIRQELLAELKRTYTIEHRE